MSMYVSGRKPTNKKGEYFHSNVWWWRRLWEFTCDVAELDDKLRKDGHSNGGAGLGKKDALAVAKALRKKLADGTVDDYERCFWEAVKNAPDVDCEYCNGTGKRVFNDGSEGNCAYLSCRGGKVKPSWTNFPFKREVVEEFAGFLAHCGGFNIW